ncbi:hypothetical protein BX666DRAFT_2117993 [Dichotomocladium elegans]|nr:hypothetical protein BX666DRAFT_2117993 [Dichotomocladium elegans]
MARLVDFLQIVLIEVLLLQFFAGIEAISVTDVDECPALPARTSAPGSVSDLRIDDIKVIAALGDSIMAGFGMMGYKGGLDLGALLEYRGNSWGVGGDDGAITLATMAEHFNPDIKGASVAEHIVSLCGGNFCAISHRPLRDKLNAAISGAIAADLNSQLDYLIPLMKTTASNFTEDWKLITIQIGSNDQCSSCGDKAGEVAVEQFGAYVAEAIARIKENIPRVIVNLVGVFKVSPVYSLTEGQEYCRPLGNDSATILNRKMCGCFSGGDENRNQMDVHAEGYNGMLLEIYNQYKNQQSPTFGIAYQPANINLANFPITALSNLDCFHPSLDAHQWIAKSIWNGLFTPQASKPNVLDFDPDLKIYCPVESDRIMIN